MRRIQITVSCILITEYETNLFDNELNNIHL